ncbi:uncharacterized protein LOC108736735 [Agrilus planipennis]|uniref:Uncharacterized protein LOC108736735 n=1 Tax=Agrilus planipennis TaxID=224129 RepID=A0A1W4WW96_AGRPL|nr:uncharacterized protein LOC108736735 [Agrilus planipennis]
MKLSVSAYRAHASAHKKILDTAYQHNYGSTAPHPSTSTSFQLEPPPLTISNENASNEGKTMTDDEDASSDDVKTPLQSPKSQTNSKEEEESSLANSSDNKSPNTRGHTSYENPFDDKKPAKVGAQRWKNLQAVMAYYHSLRKIKRCLFVL